MITITITPEGQDLPVTILEKILYNLSYLTSDGSTCGEVDEMYGINTIKIGLTPTEQSDAKDFEDHPGTPVASWITEHADNFIICAYYFLNEDGTITETSE